MDVHPPIGKETLEIGFFVSASRQQCAATASTTPFFPFCHGENIARGLDTTSVHVFFGERVDSNRLGGRSSFEISSGSVY